MAEDLTHSARTGGSVVVETSAPPASPPGYELRDEIGRGGMGVVYRARDTALDRDVAVKLLSEQYPADSPAAGRFLGEARITGQLQHPGIPAVHQVGTRADPPFPGGSWPSATLVQWSWVGEGSLRFRIPGQQPPVPAYSSLAGGTQDDPEPLPASRKSTPPDPS